MNILDNILYKSSINKLSIINIIINTFKFIDKRIVNHGERVAYIAYEIYKHGDLEYKIDFNKLFILSIFHDIGAFKTEEIDDMLMFDDIDYLNHCIYGYLFLRDLTPLKEFSEAILYHHLSFNKLLEVDTKFKDYAAIIYLADKLDVYFSNGNELSKEMITSNLNLDNYSKEFLDIFFRALDSTDIKYNLESGKYIDIILNISLSLDILPDEYINYLKILIYSIDFRSENTVTHTINTKAISLYIADRMNLSMKDRINIFFGSLLHDLGKILTPVDILDYPSKLSDEQMIIMKSHVLYTEKILKNTISDEICNIASRHHEKLDGSGYPYGLTAKDLSTPERIVAVADIISALGTKRSYKDSFPKEKILSIISDMKAAGKLDPEICDIVLNEYSQIIKNTDVDSDPVIKIYLGILNDYKKLQTKINY